jgi:hypothetical protein
MSAALRPGRRQDKLIVSGRDRAGNPEGGQMPPEGRLAAPEKYVKI